MATEIDIKINTANAAKSIGDVRKAIKDLDNAAFAIGEGGKGFDELRKKSAELKDSLEDLKDSTQTLKGSGIEKLNGSIGLLKEGFVNADPGKLSIGMKGLGAAMKAIPIFLIIEGIRILIDNFDKLKNMGGPIGAIFKGIGTAISFITDKIKEFTDFLGLTSFALEKAQQSIIDNNKKAKDSTIERYDSQIAAAKREHKETVFLEIQKQQAILKTNQMAIDQLETRKRLNGSLSEEDSKQLTELRKENSAAYKAISDSWASYKDAQVAKAEKANEKMKALAEKQYADAFAASQRAADAENAYITEKENNAKALHDRTLGLLAEEELRLASSEQEKLRIIADRQVKELELQFEHSKILGEATVQSERDLALAKGAIQSQYAADVDALRLAEEEKAKVQAEKDVKLAEEVTKKKKELKQQEFDQAIQGAQALSSATQKVSDLYFSQQLKANEGNAKKELEIRKKQFKVNKAYGIVNATIDGIQGVAKALNNPYPLNLVLAAASAIAAAANVAAISSQEFTGSEGGGGAGTAASGTGLVATAQAPGQGNTASTNFNQDVVGKVETTDGNNRQAQSGGSNGAQRVYVLESDITATQGNIASIEQSNTF